MLFLTPDDFFQKVAQFKPIDRQKELEYARQMLDGDPEARNAIIEGYLPHLAAVLRRAKPEYRTLRLILGYCAALEKAVDSFDFLQNSERFSHRLDWYLRQTFVRYIAER